MEKILEIKDLAISFQTYRGNIMAVRKVNLTLNKGEALGIVGESGCGKSVTAHAIMGLLPTENSTIEQGHIFYQNSDLTTLDDNSFAKLRGNDIAMIFQDPMTSLNPALTIGRQIKEILFLHQRISNTEATAKTIDLLTMVGIPFAEKRIHDYPHQFSGGMRQRVMIAMALACEPKILIADEPTTALDVTVQAQILALLHELKTKLQMSIILISHDLGVIANLCDKVAVMYAGQIVESASINELFYQSHHPYTQGLLKSLPHLNMNKQEPLYVINGQPPDLKTTINYCPFVERCPYAMKICLKTMPTLTNISSTHQVKCWLEHEYAPKEIIL